MKVLYQKKSLKGKSERISKQKSITCALFLHFSQFSFFIFFIFSRAQLRKTCV